MTAAYKLAPSPCSAEPFAESRLLLDEMIAEMSCAESLARGHEEVEQAILKAGRGLLRQLFQDHLNLRTMTEPRVRVVGEDKVERPERRHGRRKLRSLLGPVVWTRYLYQQAANDARAPADACLGLSEDGFSMGVRRGGGAGVRRRCVRPLCWLPGASTRRSRGVREVHAALR